MPTWHVLGGADMGAQEMALSLVSKVLNNSLDV